MARSIFISYQHADQMKAKGFNLMRYAKNLDVNFVGRHLLDPVKSSDSDYVSRQIKEQLKGTSVTIVLIGKDTADSDWVSREIQWSLEKDSPNGLVGIKLDPDATVPTELEGAGADILNWDRPEDVKEFEPAIERAALAAGRPRHARDWVRKSQRGGCCEVSSIILEKYCMNYLWTPRK